MNLPAIHGTAHGGELTGFHQATFYLAKPDLGGYTGSMLKAISIMTRRLYEDVYGPEQRVRLGQMLEMSERVYERCERRRLRRRIKRSPSASYRLGSAKPGRGILGNGASSQTGPLRRRIDSRSVERSVLAARSANYERPDRQRGSGFGIHPRRHSSEPQAFLALQPAIQGAPDEYAKKLRPGRLRYTRSVWFPSVRSAGWCSKGSGPLIFE